MTNTIVAVYDTAGHTGEAIAALLRAGVPHSYIHRHIREGDDLTSERPAIVEDSGHGLWSALIGTDQPVDHVIYDGSPEAGGTVVRVTMIPEAHYEAVLDILQRYHPSDVQGHPPNSTR